MSHSITLCAQIKGIVFLGRDFDWNPLLHFKAKAVKSIDFFRVVGEQAEGLAAQITQNLGAKPLFA